MKRRRYRVSLSLALAAIGCVLVSCNRQPQIDYSQVTVVRVFDGDTVQINTGDYVRFIGIDCPELTDSDKLYRQAERWHLDLAVTRGIAKDAASFVSGKVYNRNVRLEFDAERYDKYGRLLAYVYLEDGTFLNELLLKRGYADLLTIPPNTRYRELFMEAHEQAVLNEMGLWGH